MKSLALRDALGSLTRTGPVALLGGALPLGSALTVLVFAAACAKPVAKKPPVFGGKGAEIEASQGEIPLDETNAQAQAVDEGPCAKPAPPGDRVEVDDFEDADNKIFKVFEREGWWYTATDGTDGEQVFPEKGTFAPVPLPEDERTDNNEYAAHLTAQGQTDWGVVWGTTLKWTRKGIGCPYNASSFAGLEFRAKGPATVWVNFATPGTTPRENGGKCTEKCWDSYGKLVRIKEGWHNYQIRWEELQQEGWGTDVRFDNQRVMNINFSAKTAHLPADLWIDDLRFLAAPGSATPTPSPPAASASAAPKAAAQAASP